MNLIGSERVYKEGHAFLARKGKASFAQTGNGAQDGLAGPGAHEGDA